TYIKWPWWV
nr:Chain C, 9-mer peptide from the HCoV spike protein [Human coronavirus 229E]